MADITAETIQKILDVTRPELHDVQDVHGVTATYSTKGLTQVMAKAPELPDLVNVSTLSGLADLVRAGLEDLELKDAGFLIHVEDPTTVALIDRNTDAYGRRMQLIQAKPVEFDRFTFGRWMPQEEFVIAVASKFADTPDKDYVLQMAATLTNEEARTSEDNGFVQKVNVKAGLRHVQEQTVKPQVALAPFRTFPEIEQPVSAFVFRARCLDRGPELMLLEADGGRWKVDAMARIRAAIEAMELGLVVIA